MRANDNEQSIRQQANGSSLNLTGVRVPALVELMESVPGAVATGSQRITRIEIAGIVTRSLTLSVLTFMTTI